MADNDPMEALYFLFFTGAVIGLVIAGLRRWYTWRTAEGERAMRRLALWVLGMWTGIVTCVSVYALVNPDGLSRIPAMFGIVAGVVGVATVWRAARIQREFFSDPPPAPEDR